MESIGLTIAQRLSEIEMCIKDDLLHTVLGTLPLPTIYTLALLFEKDEQGASKLAAGVGVPATSFTPTLDRLENLGLIARSPHQSDRRSIIISLTSEGEKLRNVVEQALMNAEAKYGER